MRDLRRGFEPVIAECVAVLIRCHLRGVKDLAIADRETRRALTTFVLRPSG